MTTLKALQYWANGLVTTKELEQIVKTNGHKLSRENNVIHVGFKNGKPDYSVSLARLLNAKV